MGIFIGYSRSYFEAQVSGEKFVGRMGVSSVEIPAQDYEIIPAIIANQFGHLIYLAVPTAAISLSEKRE